MPRNPIAASGDVVTVDFAGAMGMKRRPAVVISSPLYHAHRPDVILAIVTSQTNIPLTPTDYLLQDWATAGLRCPSLFRCYFGMSPAAAIRVIGHLSDRDLQAVRNCIRGALA